jgi:Zn-dependent peptidase ImmA (M78 family)
MDQHTHDDIDKRVRRLIKEMGVREPPLDMADVVAHLEIDQSFYDINDPTFFDGLFHKMKLSAFKVKGVLQKVGMQALWLPQEDKIVIDAALPKPKHKWVTAHEIGHRLIPTHRHFLFGDTAETLDPEYHEMLEQEANYCASALTFMGKKFTTDALDTQPCWGNIHTLQTRYETSATSTLRRYVEHSHDRPMLGIVSTPPWKHGTEHKNRCRYFVPSRQFKNRFSNISSDKILPLIEDGVHKARGGPVGITEIILGDDWGKTHEFVAESFFNRYDLLTFIVAKKAVWTVV